MAINDYVLVVGPGWIEVSNIMALTTDFAWLDDLVVNQQWNYLSPWMEQVGLIPENAMVANARLVGVDGIYRFWYMM